MTLPIRVVRDGETADVSVAVAGRSLGEVLGALEVPAEGAVDGELPRLDQAGERVLVPGSTVGGLPDVEQPAACEVTVVAGPDSGRRFRLRPGRYSISSEPGASLSLRGAPAGDAAIEVTSHGWQFSGVEPDIFPISSGEVVRFGDCWLEIRSPDQQARRRGGRVNRPPRQLVPAPDRTVEIPPVQDTSHRRREVRLAMFVGPIIVGGLMAFFFQPFFALFALLGPIGALVGWLEDTHRIKKSDRRRASHHRERLDEYRAACAAVVEAAATAERSRSSIADAVRAATRASPRLWERRSHHPDAGVAVVGWGETPLAPTPLPIDPDLRTVALETAVSGVPLTVDVAAGRVVGVVDPLRANHLARSVVAQQAVWRGPADLAIAVITDQPGVWDWVKWLPHVLLDPVADTRLLASTADEIDALKNHLFETEQLTLLVVDVLDPVSLGLHDVLASPWLSSIVTVADPTSVPGTATQVVAGGEIRNVGSGASSVGSLSEPHPEVLDIVARALASAIDPERRVVGSTIPAAIALPEISPGCGAPEVIAADWLNPPPGLRFVLGMGEGGPVEVDLVDHGPHALVAGTTGSGKSELLRTLVTGLAVRYSPDEVNFVLIDYKGGSAFDACSALPHVVGLVTDLDGRLAERAQVSLEAELRRREHALRTISADDIEHYRRLGGVDLPRLVVVVDEFAALAAEVPSFMDAVIDFAQRGRSLGVHLVLATQRPAGVVSEAIRANMNLRISLRVQSVTDARDVIDDPAPASLPRHLPGRAFIKTGPGELRTVQTASVTIASRSSDIVVGPFEFAMHQSRPSPSARERGLDAIVTAVQEAASGTAEPFRPWQDPLPAMVPFRSLSGESLSVGLEDVPEAQSVVPWFWDPSANLALVGVPGSGASDALAALLAAGAGEPDLGFYVIAGGAGWDPAPDLPHLGDVVPVADTSRITRLVGELGDEIDRRSKAPWANRIVLAIDGLEPLLRALERSHATREALVGIAAGGPPVGITVVVVANRVGAMPTAMSAAVPNRLLFQLADPYEYSVLGIKPHQQPAPTPGRCIDPRTGHEIQMATADLEAIRGREDAWGPPPVGSLPPIVKSSELQAHAMFDDDWIIPVGVGDVSLAPVAWTLGPGEHALVIGSPRSGKSSMLAAIADIATDEIDVVVVASRRSPLRNQAGLEVHDGISPETLASLDDRTLLVVDDAFKVDPAGFSEALATEARIVASVRPEDLRNGYTHWTKPLRDLRTALVLMPRSPADGELVGAALPRDLDCSIPGRGYLVADGRVELCQAMLG